MRDFIRDSFFKDRLLLISLILFIAVCIYNDSFVSYTFIELKPIILLFFLFVAVKGVERSHIFEYVARGIDRGGFIAFKTLVLSFVFSLFFSIDVALIALLPLVLKMRIQKKKELFLLTAFMAHIGAALTPFGTPQNLFIFSFYNLSAIDFISSISPFVIIFFILFMATAILLRLEKTKLQKDTKLSINKKEGALFVIALFITALSVLNIFKWYIGVISVIVALLFDKKALKVDFALLFTFVLFIGISNSLKEPLLKLLSHPKHIFFLSSLLSQVISNVPSTLLLHQSTPQWEALLWGSNVGGFGTPIAALANLITYRIFASCHTKKENLLFLKDMTLWGFLLYFIGVVLYLSAN